MAKMLWLNWSGGGNLPPSLGIARELEARGNEVLFVGRPEMVPRVVAAGFRAIELTQAYASVDRYPQGTPVTRLACYLTSPEVGDEVRSVIEAESPDALLIDSMFPVALEAASHYDVPSAVFFHHFLFRLLEQWSGTDARLNGMRQQAGFAALPPLEELWKRHDRMIVTTLPQFDVPADPRWTAVRHVGPVLEDEPCALPIELPWNRSDRTPIVLVSFSSAPEQRSLQKVQYSLDALRLMDVHVVVTTAGVVDPGELSTPENAIVVKYAAHDPILERASLLITHGGHGTLMRGLKHGVPMIVMPGLAHDQAPNGRMVQELGAGLVLAGDAAVADIHEAAANILAAPSYRDAARGIAPAFAGVDGARAAADEVQTLLKERQPVLTHSLPLS